MQIRLPNTRIDPPKQEKRQSWGNRISDALLAAAIAVLPDAYQGIELRAGTYIQSEENIIERAPFPGGEVVVFSQRQGGFIGYVFAGNASGALDTAAEAAVI